MMLLTTLILAAAIGQTTDTKPAAAPVKQWYRMTNLPGWEGYGALNQAGWVVTEKFRKIGTTQEVPTADGAKAAVATTTVATTTVEAATMTAEINNDPYGFISWLNATRAAYGLAPVGHDPNLSAWAAENNSHQAARGMGHFVMGPARRQNAAFGNYGSIGSMWMNSGGHRAALLDPTIRWVGIAGLGAYWTFNAN